MKKVALTFDDGPDKYYTPKILDILNEKSVPATFFVVGFQIRLFPKVLRRIVRDGHQLGNHTFIHPRLPELTPSQVKYEIEKTEKAIYALTGLKTAIFRPPYGLYTDADIEPITESGQRIIMWSVNTLDWTGATSEQILSTVKEEVSPGAIILQHCLGGYGMLDGTVEALPQIIDQLHEEGYTFTTIDGMNN